MNALRLLPVILSFLLIAAHFYRAGNVVLTVLCLAAPLLLIPKRAWVPPLFQVALVLAALEWLRTAYMFVSMRMAFGEPWTRLALILSAVALFTALAGGVFRLRALRERYGRSKL
jgi:hypothetical protein